MYGESKQPDIMSERHKPDVPNKGRELVYFYVELRFYKIYNYNSIVRFNHVIYNEGNHFNTGDSVFVAPSTGVYLFSWTTQTFSGKYTNTELRVANTVKGTLHISLDSSTGYFSSTQVIICTATKDDHVWIQTSTKKGVEHYFSDNYNSRSSFMGVLLFKEK